MGWSASLARALHHSATTMLFECDDLLMIRDFWCASVEIMV